ncbi:extensin family protein [Xanthobacter autotrophicus]|uniref:extensin-like domain-containing protein n=1 Tax=Xanthobacter TaxID=279 RepID=UPI0024AB7E56|nr:extensin family protein [Xanthobacter autotrophicus]MDI4663211.1 extensin family protein [Xanthobacter autotrophicus]
MSCLLLAAGGPAFAAGTAPLPPKKPQAQAVAVPAPSAVRRPPLRAAPLPPPRPAELDAEDEDMPEPAAAPRLAARTVGPEEGAEAGEGAAPDFAPSSPTRPDAQAPAGAGGPGETPPAGAAREMPAACAALVEEGTIVATLEAPIASKGGCGLDLPVRLSGVRLVDGRLVSLKPASVTGCEVAAATAEWLREDLAPAVAALGSEVTAVTVAASYDCRPRNRVSGARMSEHGLGNALDVGGFELADARVLKVEKGGFPQRLRAAMKESACRRFTTVLGPGSDGYHEDHIHVDLARRRLDIRLCRWNLDAGTVVARKDKPKAKEAAPDAAAAGKGQGGAGQDGAGQDGAGQDGAVPAGAAAKPATGQRAD